LTTVVIIDHIKKKNLLDVTVSKSNNECCNDWNVFSFFFFNL